MHFDRAGSARFWPGAFAQYFILQASGRGLDAIFFGVFFQKLLTGFHWFYWFSRISIFQDPDGSRSYKQRCHEDQKSVFHLCLRLLCRLNPGRDPPIKQSSMAPVILL